MAQLRGCRTEGRCGCSIGLIYVSFEPKGTGIIANSGPAKREPRIDVRKPAVLINSDGMAIDVLILDISGSGFRLEVDDPLRIGELVSLRVDDELASGEIRWVLGKEAGGTFLSPIGFSTF